MLKEESCAAKASAQAVLQVAVQDRWVGPSQGAAAHLGHLPFSMTISTTGHICACCRWPPTEVLNGAITGSSSSAEASPQKVL